MKIKRWFVTLLITTWLVPVLLQVVGQRALAQISVSIADQCGDLSFVSVRSQAIDCVVFGDQLRAAEQNSPAIDAYNRAINLDPTLAIAYYSRGVTQSEQEQWSAAIASLEKATQLSPNFKIAYQDLEQAMIQAGRVGEAGAVSRAALSLLNVGEVMEHRQHGDRLWQQGQQSEAIAEYRKAIELAPDWPNTHNRLGIMYFNQTSGSERTEALDRAIESYGTAIALCHRPTLKEGPGIVDCVDATPIYYKNLALVYRTIGDWATQQKLPEQALAAYNREIDLNPELISFRVSSPLLLQTTM